MTRGVPSGIDERRYSDLGVANHAMAIKGRGNTPRHLMASRANFEFAQALAMGGKVVFMCPCIYH